MPCIELVTKITLIGAFSGMIFSILMLTKLTLSLKRKNFTKLVRIEKGRIFHSPQGFKKFMFFFDIFETGLAMKILEKWNFGESQQFYGQMEEFYDCQKSEIRL